MSNNVFGAFKELLIESAKVLEKNTDLDFGLSKMNEVSEQIPVNNNVTISKLEPSNDYTNIGIYGRNARFKLANPTLYNFRTDTGAFEADAALIPIHSKGDLCEEGSKTHICFSNGYVNDDEDIRNRLKRLYKVDNINIENINEGLFSKKVKIDNSSLYYEEYCMYYDTNFEGEIERNKSYQIYIILYKSEYSKEEIDKLVSEYHVVIDTFELLDINDCSY